MVSLMNGSLCSENRNKRAMENGHIIPVKYKPRKVSAIRDFPPGCGPNAQILNVNPLTNTTRLLVGKKAEDVIESHGAKPLEIDTISESDVLGNNVNTLETATRSVVANMIEDSQEAENNVLLTELTKEKPSTSDNKEQLCDGKVQARGLETDSREADAQQHSAKEELQKAKVMAMVKNVCEWVDDSVLETDDKPDVSLLLDSGKPSSPRQLPSCDVNVQVKTSSANKYARRRVSATRDFPPFCGRNAPAPTEEDRVRINSGNKNLIAVEKHGLENGVSRETSKEVMENRTSTWLATAGGGEVEEKTQLGDTRGGELMEIVSVPRQQSVAVVQKSGNNVVDDQFEIAGDEIVVFSQEERLTRKMPMNEVDVGGEEQERMIVQGLMAAASNRSKQEGNLISPEYSMSRSKAKKRDFMGQEKSNLGSTKKTLNKSFSSRASKKKPRSAQKSGYGDILDLAIEDEEDYVANNEGKIENGDVGQGSRKFEVTLPPYGPNSSSHGDVRNRVRESLRIFQAICRKVLQAEESKSRVGENTKPKKKEITRIDLFAANEVKVRGKEVNTERKILGAVPGVEVGDEFQYRVELAIIGLHRLYQGGIDYVKHDGQIVAASIVASGGYADDLDNADVLIYSGSGGLIGKDKDKQPEDQKLERGNLALKNSISARNPVRVIRGSKETKASESGDARTKIITSYVYDGLYTVDRYWQEVGKLGKLVFKFELRRIPGQPELAWKEVKKSYKSKTREGLCVDDISGGKEIMPIWAVNTIDDEKPPGFKYITEMIPPDQYRATSPKGCDCKTACVDGQRCLCAAKNGEIPYNFNGAIVETKPLVYECGPKCKCPPSCYNRVSQHGIKFQLEIFKTESRGWGVRSLNSITAGSFICEYIGELLEDTEAEKRTGNDEYLFDIGQNYNDCSLKRDEEASKIVEDGGFTIDAAQFGNVGRFINHSCSPNLYAQNVLYDHEDKRMPHIMFFAAENIPPLQELTYHYNYAVDQIRDSNGNIKVKRCYCGSAECTGRMY